jgi:hypothetical protein
MFSPTPRAYCHLLSDYSIILAKSNNKITSDSLNRALALTVQLLSQQDHRDRATSAFPTFQMNCLLLSNHHAKNRFLRRIKTHFKNDSSFDRAIKIYNGQPTRNLSVITELNDSELPIRACSHLLRSSTLFPCHPCPQPISPPLMHLVCRLVISLSSLSLSAALSFLSLLPSLPGPFVTPLLPSLPGPTVTPPPGDAGRRRRRRRVYESNIRAFGPSGLTRPWWPALVKVGRRPARRRP